MFLHCAVGKSPTRVSRELNTRQAVPALMRIVHYLNTSASRRIYQRLPLARLPDWTSLQS